MFAYGVAAIVGILYLIAVSLVFAQRSAPVKDIVRDAISECAYTNEYDACQARGHVSMGHEDYVGGGATHYKCKFCKSHFNIRNGTWLGVTYNNDTTEYWTPHKGWKE